MILVAVCSCCTAVLAEAVSMLLVVLQLADAKQCGWRVNSQVQGVRGDGWVMRQHVSWLLQVMQQLQDVM